MNEADHSGRAAQGEREQLHLRLIGDVEQGLADIAAGRTSDADTAIEQLQQRRRAASVAARSVRPSGPDV